MVPTPARPAEDDTATATARRAADRRNSHRGWVTPPHPTGYRRARACVRVHRAAAQSHIVERPLPVFSEPAV